MASTLTVFTNSTPGLPCNWTVDAGCCDIWAAQTVEMQTAAAEYGALSVWAATGRRFGACTRTVRPCGRDCGENMGWGSGFYWADGVWFPYILDGVWRNCWCGTGNGCNRCKPQCQVFLTPPVSGIVEVRFSDGTVADPATYRVDDWQWLVRQGPGISGTDGCWPMTNDYNYPVTGTLAPANKTAWQVTYLWGIPVPAVLQRAAGELACEWIKNCTGGVCRLPQRVTSIARQGVSVTLADVDQLLQNGLTGLVTVDSIIQRFNPGRLPSRMQIASPDLPTIRETTFQGF
jgi:hypothetical protein